MWSRKIGSAMLLTLMFQLISFVAPSRVMVAVPEPSGSPEPAGTSLAPLSGTTKMTGAASARAAPNQTDNATTAANRNPDFMTTLLLPRAARRPGSCRREASQPHPRGDLPQVPCRAGITVESLFHGESGSDRGKTLSKREKR